MICKHCGKEIPDESLFCGYCGNKVEEEIPAEEEIAVISEAEEETVTEIPAGEEAEEILEEVSEETAAVEEAFVETLEEVSEEEILPSEEVVNPEPLVEEEEESGIKLTLEPEEEITEAEIAEPVTAEEPEPVIEAEPEPVIEVEPQPAAEVQPAPVSEVKEEPVIETKPEPTDVEEAVPAVFEEPAPARERNLPKIDIKASDFTPLLTVLKDPFNEHELGYPAAAAVLILGLIANWMSFGFGYGLLVLLVIWAGTACVLYIAKRREFDLPKLISVCAQLLVMPTVIMLLCGLVSLLGNSSLFVLVRLFLVFLAMMIYISSLGRYTSKMNKYALALVLAVLFAVAAACMISAFADVYISMNI